MLRINAVAEDVAHPSIPVCRELDALNELNSVSVGRRPSLAKPSQHVVVCQSDGGQADLGGLLDHLPRPPAAVRMTAVQVQVDEQRSWVDAFLWATRWGSLKASLGRGQLTLEALVHTGSIIQRAGKRLEK